MEPVRFVGAFFFFVRLMLWETSVFRNNHSIRTQVLLSKFRREKNQTLSIALNFWLLKKLLTANRKERTNNFRKVRKMYRSYECTAFFSYSLIGLWCLVCSGCCCQKPKKKHTKSVSIAFIYSQTCRRGTYTRNINTQYTYIKLLVECMSTQTGQTQHSEYTEVLLQCMHINSCS